MTVGYSEGFILIYVNGILDTANDINPYKLVVNKDNLVIGNNDYDCAFGIKNFEVYNKLLRSVEIEAKSSVSFYQEEGVLGLRPVDIRFGCRECAKPKART